jgi:hypothetical protein
VHGALVRVVLASVLVPVLVVFARGAMDRLVTYAPFTGARMGSGGTRSGGQKQE